MKIENYYTCKPVKGVFKSHALMVSEGNVSQPLIYLTRPKWIEDDAVWGKIVEAVGLSLPYGFEVK